MGYAIILEPRHAGWRCLPIQHPDQETGEHVASRVRLLFSEFQGIFWYHPAKSAEKVYATEQNFDASDRKRKGQNHQWQSGSSTPSGSVQTRKTEESFLTIHSDAIVEFLLGRHGCPAHTERTFAKLKCNQFRTWVLDESGRNVSSPPVVPVKTQTAINDRLACPHQHFGKSRLTG